MASQSITPDNPPPPSTTPSTKQPPPPPSPPKEILNDPARTGFDPETKWWMNYFKILTGNMTPEGQFHYREWRYRVHEERDCKRCDEYRDWLFAYSPVVRFMSDRVRALNGRLDAENVVCRRCPARLDEDGQVRRQSGGFSPDHGILLCANEVRDRKHLEDTLAHEMVHAWDHLRWKVDWTGDKDLKHAACAEVRFLIPLNLSPSIHCPPPLFPPHHHHRFLTNILPDPSLNAQRRVPMDPRSLHARQLETNAAVPKLRAGPGHPVCHGSPALQG